MFDVTIVADDIAEGNETIILNIDEGSLPAGFELGGNPSHTITIPVNDNTIEFQDLSRALPGNNRPAEGGLHAITVLAESSRALPDGGITVNFSFDITGEVTADDVTLSVVSYTFTETASSVNISANVERDDLAEQDETVKVRMTAVNLPTNGWSIGEPVIFTIPANGNETDFLVPSSTVVEGDSNTQHEITIDVAGQVAADASLALTVDGSGSADEGTDFRLSTMSVPIKTTDSNGRVTFDVTIIADDTPERDETIVLNIDPASLPTGFVVGDNPSHTITIPVNDGRVGFALGRSIAVEEDDLPNHHEVKLTVEGKEIIANPRTLVFIAGKGDNRATENSDFTLPIGGVSLSTFTDETKFNVPITILQDDESEEQEFIYLSIDPNSLPDGFSIGPISSHRITVPANDNMSRIIGFAPFDGLTRTTIPEGELTGILAGVDPAVHNNLPDGGIEVKFSTTPPGQATFTAPEIVSFNPNSHTFHRDDLSRLQLGITPNDDTDAETEKSFVVNMEFVNAGTSDGWVIGPGFEFIVPASDNTIELFVPEGLSFTEGAGSQQVATAVAEIPAALPTEGIKVNFSIEYGGGVTMSDVTLVTTSHMFTSEAAVANIMVSVLDDSVSEGSEMVTIKMELAEGETLPEGWSLGDNPTPPTPPSTEDTAIFTIQDKGASGTTGSEGGSAVSGAEGGGGGDASSTSDEVDADAGDATGVETETDGAEIGPDDDSDEAADASDGDASRG